MHSSRSSAPPVPARPHLRDRIDEAIRRAHFVPECVRRLGEIAERVDGEAHHRPGARDGGVRYAESYPRGKVEAQPGPREMVRRGRASIAADGGRQNKVIATERDELIDGRVGECSR